MANDKIRISGATIFFCLFQFSIQVNTTLKELHLAKVDMRDFGAERLADAMERNDTLELLDISG